MMFVLQPIFHHTIWGGNRLTGIYGSDAVNLAHLYSVRCKSGDESNIVMNGKYASQKLFDIIGTFPLTIAIDDAAMDLSIQVHPGGDKSKYESYYFIEAPHSGYIYSGLSTLDYDDIMTEIGNVAIIAGDYAYIPPQTVHALTAGSLVYEIECGEDNTFRLYDYNRLDRNGKRRDLQVEQAKVVTDTSSKSTVNVYPLNSEIIESVYSTKLLSGLTEYTNQSSTIECFTFLGGDVLADSVPLKMGMSVLLEPNESLYQITIEKCIVARYLK